MAAAAALRSIARRVSLAFARLLVIASSLIFPLPCPARL